MSEQRASTPDWALAELACREQMDLWLCDAMARQRRIPWLGYSDEATFMATMIPYYFLSGDEGIKDFIYEMRDRWQGWAINNFHHGYYKRNAEEHHQTEDYYRVFGRLWYLEPFNRANTGFLDDMAEHLGNWVGGIPQWYDWKRHRFTSRYIGTWYVSEDAEFKYNSPGFFRYILIVLLAHLGTGRGQYLDLAIDYADRWCDLLDTIPEGAPIPMQVDEDWKVIASTPDGGETGVGLRTSHTFMTGGFIGSMMDLYCLTRNKRYINSARKVLGLYLKLIEKDKPMSGILAGALAQFNLLTGESLGKEEILAGAKYAMGLPLPDAMEMPGRPPNTRLYWKAADNKPEEQVYLGTANLAAAYQLTGEESYIAQAMRMTARRLLIARSIGDDSRGHGCASGSAKGIAGGDMLASLIPATLGIPGYCFDGFGHYKALAGYRGPHGAIGLPKEVSALYHYGSLDECAVTLVNLGAEPTVVMVTSYDGLMRRRLDNAPYLITRQRFNDLDRIPPPWEQVANESVVLEPGQKRTVKIPFPQEFEVFRGH